MQTGFAKDRGNGMGYDTASSHDQREPRKKNRVLKRVLLWSSATLLTLALVATLAVVYVLRAPLPKTAGELEIKGLTGEVSVVRDELGIPHIYAESDADLMRAQGFVDAQDRFFQMDVRRHQTAGRLAEMLGDVEQIKDSDVLIRSLQWRDRAEQDAELLSEEARGLYEAYAAGVNEYLRGKAPWQVANEYVLLGLSGTGTEIEPWTIADSLSWLRSIAYDLQANPHQESSRVQSYSVFGDTAIVEEFNKRNDESEYPPILSADEVSQVKSRDEYIAEAGSGAGASSSGGSSEQGGVVDPPATGQSSAAAAPTADTATTSTAAAPAADTVAAQLETVARELQRVTRIVDANVALGSNAFVVSGEHTASGKPILANDPHLTISYPSTWHQIGLHCVGSGEGCSFDVAGFGFAGVPGVMIGRNAQLSWGITSFLGDTADLVVERNLSEDSYERDGVPVAYETRTEEFKVAGGESFRRELKRSVHGPIVPDKQFVSVDALNSLPAFQDAAGGGSEAGDSSAAGGGSEAGFSRFSIALQSTGDLLGYTGEGFLALNRAKNPTEVQRAARLITGPNLSLVYATDGGDIGYVSTGKIPIRPKKAESDFVVDGVPSADNLGADGRWPRPGWDSSYDWRGLYENEQIPSTVNPDDGIIVSTNNDLAPADVGPYLGTAFDHGNRAKQMRERIVEFAKDGGLTLKEAGQVMLADRVPVGYVIGDDLAAVDFAGFDPTGVKPRKGVEQPKHTPTVKQLEEMRELLSSWVRDGSHSDVDAQGMPVAASLASHLQYRLFADEFAAAQPEPAEFAPDPSSTAIELLRGLLADPQNPLWDDVSTPEITETANDILRLAYVDAYRDLSQQLGTNTAEWRWGDLHKETPAHPLFGGEGMPWFIRALFSRDAHELAGGPSAPQLSYFNPSVNPDGTVSYENHLAASMRYAVDMSGVNKAMWVDTSGSSGHPLSPHVNDQFEHWATGKYFSWRFSRKAITEQQHEVLTLKPAADPAG